MFAKFTNECVCLLFWFDKTRSSHSFQYFAYSSILSKGDALVVEKHTIFGY